jgi:CDP-diacylglycerol--glycerol-3-phosphate 3-phosphatidyltransferase
LEVVGISIVYVGIVNKVHFLRKEKLPKCHTLCTLPTDPVNIPNSITAFRLVLTAVFIAAITMQQPWANILALITFIVAAASDWFDGYFARKLDLVTSLGKLLDPLADKILVAAGFIYLSSNFYTKGLCPVWVSCVIIGREFMVTGLRQIAVEQGVVIAADKLGKWKTTFQLTFIITCLTHISFDPFKDDNWFSTLLYTLSAPENYLMPITLWGAVALTLISGWNYLWGSREFLKG